ncbi:MAG: thiolase family protein [Firmicutes bacterium]|jgi:acetyl-CoA C-acetyltransferase|nr:thiolase family protein [Bacillota bacterium]
MREVVIVSGVRTAIGAFGGWLKDTPAQELGGIAIREAVNRAGLAADLVDEVVFGNCIQTVDEASNIARSAALAAGLPFSVPAMTVNRLCGSGLQAVNTAAHAIMSGDADVVVAGGAENMSRAPYILKSARFGYRIGHGQLVDALTGILTDPAAGNASMGMTAENLAELHGLTRGAQDQFALESQRKAKEAIEAGRFEEQIVPVKIERRDGTTIEFKVDEHPKPGITLEQLARLKPAFKKDGTVTAGNASGINDGAAALLLMESSVAARLGIRPMAVIRPTAVAGVEPAYMGYGPVPASKLALKRAGLTLDQVDVIEANEAFAAVCLAIEKGLGWDRSKVNPNGGAIALGHPIGATGAILAVKAMYWLKDAMKRYALVTLCIGGGQGIATVLERA